MPTKASSPHPATVLRVQPPHPAQVLQSKAPHPATVLQSKAPHPATLQKSRHRVLQAMEGPDVAAAGVSGPEPPPGYDFTDLRKKVVVWVERPITDLNDCLQWGTSNCHTRALTLLPLAWNVSSRHLDLTTSTFAAVKGTIDAVFDKPPGFKVVIFALRVRHGFAGASGGTFNSPGNPACTHTVLLVHRGTDDQRRQFYVIFDPDVTATQKSRDAWEKYKTLLSSSGGALKTLGDPYPVLVDMVLGGAEHPGLGPLFRYFYPG